MLKYPLVQDVVRKIRRFNFDSVTKSGLSYRKLFFLLVGFAIFLLYFGPSAMRWLFTSDTELKNPHLRCLDDRLTEFFDDFHKHNAHIRVPGEPVTYLPYVGNGYFGLTVEEDSHFNVRSGRSLGLGVGFHPIVSISSKNGLRQEATVTEYQTGLVHRYQCYDEFYVRYLYYAHRNMPSVLVQEIEVTNTKNQLIDVDLIVPRMTDWAASSTRNVKLQHGSNILDYQVTTGFVESTTESPKIVVISIVSRQMERILTLKKRGVTKLEVLTTISYSEPIPRNKYEENKAKIENEATESIKKALLEAQHQEGHSFGAYYRFRKQHVEVWRNLWDTGFQISTSKAENTINGDRINATIYACLSQVRAFEFEESITPAKREEIARALTYAEGCYGGYHTLQADNLWKGLDTLDEINSVVSTWLLTLEKQGCHNLIKAGASGVIQAMVLSFGGFRFSNQHLEFDIHPKFLHRDYHFRRLNYGNLTHINITVTVNDDNKAVMFVSVDREDKLSNYYACDAGCLDEPVPLSQSQKQFPVKLTEPITSILYITTDKQHIEDLRHALHVKEVVEAPAHQSHIIALHKHGHSLGGLPTLFWFSICAIIIIFHVFLCKLVVKEYCEPPDKIRYRMMKP